MKFVLIDQVLERGPERLVALKNVTSAEEYLADHFPGFPVLPGVMMLETLAQAGREFVQGMGQEKDVLVVSEVRNIRYANMVRPGESLKVEVTLRKRDEKGYEFEGVGSVGDKVAVQGRFRLAPLTPPWA